MPEGKAPHFPQQPVARQNDDGSLELECFLEASPQPEIKWFYDTTQLSQGGRFNFRLDNKGGDNYSAVLQIKELADSDAGAYRCAIVNPYGKGNANFNLKLTGFSSPTFIEKPQISSREHGRVMIMEFKAKSILKPQFVWQKGDEIIAESDRIKIVLREVGNNEYYSALEILEPKKEKDAGQFVCTAKNESGKLTATFSVKFEVPQGAPTFTRKPQILQKLLNRVILLSSLTLASKQKIIQKLHGLIQKIKKSRNQAVSSLIFLLTVEAVHTLHNLN